MIFKQLEIDGIYSIELEKIEDNRGYFARSWDKKEFDEHNLNSNLVQCNISFNKTKGTIRGIHYQDHPYEETKIVRCVNGKVFEVFVDLRKDSKTFLRWGGIELDSEKLSSLYVPEGIGLGFQTLVDNSELFYQMTQVYVPSHAKGIRWNDPKLKITWPLELTVISKRDISFEFL